MKKNIPPKLIVDTAKELVFGDRNMSYGHPNANFDDIAGLQNAYLEIVRQRCEHEKKPFALNHFDVANMNILQKLARLGKNQKHLDSLVDVVGYALCQERIIKQI